MQNDPDQLASSDATDLDLHCLQGQGISGISRTRVKTCQAKAFYFNEDILQLSPSDKFLPA